MVMTMNLELGATDAVMLGLSRTGKGRPSANAVQRPVRSLDCAAMARMTLPALLYYVLAGDGRRLEASS